MQNYFDNINSGYYDRVIGDIDGEIIEPKFYEKEESKEDIAESEKNANQNLNNLNLNIIIINI